MRSSSLYILLTMLLAYLPVSNTFAQDGSEQCPLN